jgi:L-ascorbate metabolism protein UlaG (beta-lactamase superfamily)
MRVHDALLAPRRGMLGTEAAGPEVHVRWLGTAGFELRCGEHVLLIDPYVTRSSLTRCIAAPLVSDESRVQTIVPRADAIVVGHTHFDHALDVPAIARHTGALVYGSRSAAALCLSAGVTPSKIVDVEEALSAGGARSGSRAGNPAGTSPGYESEVGPFRLRFLASAHSRLVLGKVPLPGDIDDCDALPMRLHHYKCGAVFGVEIRVAGRTLFHLGSAEIVEESLAPIAGREVDLLLCCVAGWTKSERFPERAMKALSPRSILLSHWDDFFRPFDEKVRALPAVGLPRLVDRLTAASRDARIHTLDLLGETTL